MARGVSQRELFAVLHEREFRFAFDAVRRLLPGHGVTRGPGRDLARALIGHERLMQEVMPGDARGASIGRDVADPELLARCEQAHGETRRRLSCLSERAWEEPVEAPAGLALWPSMRRGEMLWMTLRELVEQVEVCTRHLGDELASV